jgi:hypothetical protein
MRPAPKSKNRAHTGSMEMRAIWSYIDLTWRSNSVTWCAPKTFVDAATYSSGTPLTMSTLASPRTSSAFASVGVSPTSIVVATLGRDDSAFTLGAVAAVQTTIWFPFQ